GQFLEWRYDDQLEWNLLDMENHKKLHAFVKDLNHFYLDNKALWENETSWDGFRWVNEADNENSVLSYIRRGKNVNDNVVVVANFTPVSRPIYKIGVPVAGSYEVVLHSNASKYGGTRRVAKKTYKAVAQPYSDMAYTIEVEADGNSIMMLKKKPEKAKKPAAKKTTTAKKSAAKKTTSTK
ncbi:MAG: alpha amylase C-terminal domain-containing protein, partial [Clostridia bacterium]|nr:alpha amylase C-terminal domain-containing protein [Clostridia bacterium]